LEASSCGHREARTDPFGEAHRVVHREPGRPEGLEGHGAAGLGDRAIAAGPQADQATSCSKVGSRGSIPSSAPGKSQVGGRCQLALLLARGGRKRQGSRRGAVSYTRVAFSGYDNTAPIRWEEVPVKRHPYRIASEDEPTADRFGQIFAPNIVFRSPVAADPVQGVEVVEPSRSLPIR